MWSTKEKKNREGKRAKFLAKENICFMEEKKKREGKVGKNCRNMPCYDFRHTGGILPRR